VHVPGWGIDGVVLSIAGGRNDTETLEPMNIIEVYDVQTSQWYRQPTDGQAPNGRINACITTTAAADGSSFNIHMFGGQSVGANPTLYNDMWILSVPAFTWIEVPTSISAPSPRAGHTCDLWDGQMIVVGGTVTKDLACDSPGVYIFNTSALEWSRTFTALSGDDNPFSQQYNQRGATKDSGLKGSYGYKVPSPIIAKIGGDANGLATVTVPLVGQATWAHTTSVSYNTASLTATATPVALLPAKSSGGTNIGAAIAGAVAGFFFLIAVYLAFCALVYRHQIAAYKKKVAKLAAKKRNKNWNGEEGTINKSGSWRKASWFSGRGSQKSQKSDGSQTALGGDEKRQTQESRDSGATSPTFNYIPPRSPARPPPKQFVKTTNGVADSHEDLGSVDGMEPSYWGVLLHPRSNLRVINR